MDTMGVLETVILLEASIGQHKTGMNLPQTVGIIGIRRNHVRGDVEVC
jgi:hypothetical protein